MFFVRDIAGGRGGRGRNRDSAQKGGRKRSHTCLHTRIASARDGTIRLWECATGQMLRMVVRAAPAGISKMLLVSRLPEAWVIQSTGGEAAPHAGDREVDTAGKVVVYGCEDGFVGLACVATGQKVSSPGDGSILECHSQCHSIVGYGDRCQAGIIGRHRHGLS